MRRSIAAVRKAVAILRSCCCVGTRAYWTLCRCTAAEVSVGRRARALHCAMARRRPWSGFLSCCAPAGGCIGHPALSRRCPLSWCLQEHPLCIAVCIAFGVRLRVFPAVIVADMGVRVAHAGSHPVRHAHTVWFIAWLAVVPQDHRIGLARDLTRIATRQGQGRPGGRGTHARCGKLCGSSVFVFQLSLMLICLRVAKVFMGCVLQAGLGQAPARQAAVRGGASVDLTAFLRLRYIHTHNVSLFCFSSWACRCGAVVSVYDSTQGVRIRHEVRSAGRTNHLVGTQQRCRGWRHGQFLNTYNLFHFHCPFFTRFYRSGVHVKCATPCVRARWYQVWRCRDAGSHAAGWIV